MQATAFRQDVDDDDVNADCDDDGGGNDDDAVPTTAMMTTPPAPAPTTSTPRPTTTTTPVTTTQWVAQPCGHAVAIFHLNYTFSKVKGRDLAGAATSLREELAAKKTWATLPGCIQQAIDKAREAA